MMTTKTYRLREQDMDRAWHVCDAEARPLGRLASEVATLLLGKHKPTYEPHLAMGDFVIVINASKVAVTGQKSLKKIYYHHSGYPGGLSERTLEQQLARDPRRVVERAVRGMLPHNSRGRELFRHLKVYGGPEHPHQAQLTAGTGLRARRNLPTGSESIAAGITEPRAVDTSVVTESIMEAPVEKPSVPLSRWKRAELDDEAERIGITIEPGWKKQDVIAAIAAHRSATDNTAEQDG